MPNQKNIEEKLEKELLFIEEQRNFVIKRSLDWQIDTIRQGRDLLRDVVIISTTVVGFVIPLMLNSNIKLDRNLLLLSAICFMAVIIYGISLLLFVLRKELERWPETLHEILNKLNKDKLAMTHVLENPTRDNYENACRAIAERHKPKKEEEKLWNKFINHDVIFYGLFFTALVFLMISILKANFNFQIYYDILNYFKI